MTDQSRTDFQAVCFVNMPFGKKPDLTSGVAVDFDPIYELAIKHDEIIGHIEARLVQLESRT